MRLLFAIAFATAIVNGVPPGKFVFDRSKMRRHLHKSFKNRKLEMFPTLKEQRGATQIKSNDAVKVFCTCRMPELPDIEMVECC